MLKKTVKSFGYQVDLNDYENVLSPLTLQKPKSQYNNLFFKIYLEYIGNIDPNDPTYPKGFDQIGIRLKLK